MSVTVLEGNVLETLKQVAPGSARCAVTSPPYYGLRSYLKPGDPLKALEIGAEETPELYIAKLVDVFRLVWDALSDDGTLWLNLGDSYAGGKTGRYDSGTRGKFGGPDIGFTYNEIPAGLKRKDLLMIPARVALALQADGWYLRSEIVWHKPNPMPESVKDRPTRGHEMIYLLSKNESYFYDYKAIAEPAGSPITKLQSHHDADNPKYDGAPAERWLDQFDGRVWGEVGTRNKRDVWTVSNKPYAGAHFAVFPPDLIEPCILAGSAIGDTVLDPFGGSGTTAEVAIRHNRNAILCELNSEYIELIDRRMSDVQPYLAGATK